VNKVEAPITNGIRYRRFDLKCSEVKEKYGDVEQKK